MILPENPVFEETYAYYLEQINAIALPDVAGRLGAVMESGTLCLELFGRPYRISRKGIAGPDGKRPNLEICVILFKYLLLCPLTPPDGREWVSFKDFKDAAPLVTYFSNEVEGAIASHFTGNMASLERASSGLGGSMPDLDASYDLARQFTALPEIPLVLLFNDADDEFQATGTVLFRRRTEAYLDAECIAMLGGCLYKELTDRR